MAAAEPPIAELEHVRPNSGWRPHVPACRAGTLKVAELRRKYAPDKVLRAIYGCNGLEDIEAVGAVLEGATD